MNLAAHTALHRHAERVWELAAPLWPGLTLEICPHIDSTNAELMRRARSGRQEPVLLAAAHQSAGRGRLGRTWSSQPGECLTFSIGVPLHPPQWSGLSLAVGASLATALPPSVRIKWPNDLWWNERKLGGILVETASVGEQRYAVVGVGLNLLSPASLNAPSPPNTAPSVPPVGLLEVLGHPPDPPDVGDVLLQLAPTLLRDLRRFEQGGWAAFAQRFAARDALWGRSVALSDGQQGVAVGVRDDGALWLDQGHRLLAVTQQEVSVRPC